MTLETEQVQHREQVRIVSDGGLLGTRVYREGGDGDEMKTVREVHIDIHAGQIPTADIVVLPPAVDVKADATIHAPCPYCGRETLE